MSGARSVMELSPFGRLFPSERAPGADKPTGRIVDMHVHFDEKNPQTSPPVALSTCMCILMRKIPDFSTIC